MDNDIEKGVDDMEMEDSVNNSKPPVLTTSHIIFRSENEYQPQSPPEDLESLFQNQDVTEKFEDLGLLTSVDPENVNEIRRLRGLVDTTLHRAVEQQDITGIKSLMDAGASPASFDWAGMTPLHLCIVKKLIEPFTALLSYKSSADVKDASGLSVLQVAVLHRWRDGVCAALAAGANVTDETLAHVSDAVINRRYQQVLLSQFGLTFYEDTLLHLAVKSGDLEILDKITAATRLNFGVDSFNESGVTPLYTAIKCDNLETVQFLVKSGASVNRVSARNDTALHVAVDKPHILKFLLDNTDVKNYPNDDGSAAIHLAVSINQLDSVRLLLDKKQHIYSKPDPIDDLIIECKTNFKSRKPRIIIKQLNRKSTTVACSDTRRHYPFRRTESHITSIDGNGYTPLHIAAKQRNMTMISLLLRRGAKLSTKGAKGRTALEIIASEFYNPSKCFELIFDKFISTKQVLGDTVVNVDYTALTNVEGVSQMKVIEELVRCGQKQSLIHPFIESLLYLKWKHLLPAFYALIGVYTTFLLAFNIFVVNIIHYRDKNNSSFYTSVTSKDEIPWFEFFDGWYWLLIGLIYMSITLLLLQEMFYIYLRRFNYFLSLETWVKLGCLTLGGIVPIAESFVEPPDWLRHAASTALLLSWLQAMFLVSRFPKWGYYVLIFGKVTINIFKILITSICLVIGFSFCFMIEYHSAPPFDDPFAAFVKTVVMMSSEFDYEDLFGNEHDKGLRDTKIVIRLFFVVFVIFVAIILMNFMIGIAVSDISDLQMSGSIKRLEKQVELLSSLEVLVNNKMLTGIFGGKKYHKNISNYVGFQSKWRAALNRYECYHVTLPSALHAAIIDIAWKKEQREERNSIIISNKYKLNALYDAIVDRPVVTDEENEKEQLISSKKPREEQSRLDKQIKLLADNLLTVNNDVKNSIEKINQITLDVTTIKEMLVHLAYEESP